MTHDERIEAMSTAMCTAKCACVPEWPDCAKCEAQAAYDAADVEGMVREAVSAGWHLGGSDPDNGEITDADLNAIVGRVCGNE